MKSILLLFLCFLCSSSFYTYSQNLITNPDFSDISIYYQNGKKVYPNNWKSINWPPFPYFAHPAKNDDDELFGKKSNSINSNGIVGIQILYPSEGVVTKLKSTLIAGQIYDIEIELRIKKKILNSNWKGSIYNLDTRRRVDSTELDFNYVISLVTFFSPTVPNINNKNSRRFAILDFPSNITPDSTNWIKLSKTYTASGDEDYFTIGTDNSDDYVEILRGNKNDTIDYSHKWAYYLIKNVSILHHKENLENNLCISDSFELDSIMQKRGDVKFVFRNVNFDLASFELREESKTEINRIVSFLLSDANVRLNLIGHTDSIGTKQYNQELSENRARSVYQYIISRGVKEDRLRYKGEGENQPLNEILLKENFGRNRRVEFEFIKE